MGGKIDKSASRVGGEETDFDLLADVQALLALLDASVDRRSQDSRKRPARGNAGDDRVKILANVPLHDGRSYDLSHLSLNLAGGFLLIVAMRGN